MSPVKSLVKPERQPDKYRRILGIDSSSTGIAWSLVVDNQLIACDKIRLDKIKDVDKKLSVTYWELLAVLRRHQPDHVFVEKSIFVKNPATARLLSYVVGTVIATCSAHDFEVTDVEPATWKAFFKYKNISTKFVREAKAALGDTEGKKLCDRLRKSQTMRVLVHNYPEAKGTVIETDHDIADSLGLSVFGYDKLNSVLALEISDSIRLDLDELARIGLSL
jgi:hypothetical protein